VITTPVRPADQFILAYTKNHLGLPQWSPDGHRLAYTWQSPASFPSGPVAVHTIDVASGQVQIIYQQPHDEEETALVA
jgi:Tol biopolymer transport system component